MTRHKLLYFLLIKFSLKKISEKIVDFQFQLDIRWVIFGTSGMTAWTQYRSRATFHCHNSRCLAIGRKPLRLASQQVSMYSHMPGLSYTIKTILPPVMWLWTSITKLWNGGLTWKSFIYWKQKNHNLFVVTQLYNIHYLRLPLSCNFLKY